MPTDPLIAWLANATADFPVDNWADLAQFPPSKRLAKLKTARFDDRDIGDERSVDSGPGTCEYFGYAA